MYQEGDPDNLEVAEMDFLIMSRFHIEKVYPGLGKYFSMAHCNAARTKVMLVIAKHCLTGCTCLT